MLRVSRWTLCALGIFVWTASPLSAAEKLVVAAPDDVRALLKSGGVSLELYDPSVDESDLKNFHGSATFELFLAAPYSVDFNWEPDGGWKRVSIATKFQPIESRITHKIKVPHQANRAEFWNHPLVRHELDHVAISTDPRTLLLFQRTLKTLALLERRIQLRSTPKISGVSAIVNEELRLRREAIYDLIRHQNRKLDDQTQHGAIALLDRDVFFRELYEKPSLDEASFPFLADVLGLLKEKSYREITTLQLAAAIEVNSAPPAKQRPSFAAVPRRESVLWRGSTIR